LKLRGAAPKDVHLDFGEARIDIAGEKATLRYRSTLKTPEFIGAADEIFRLRKTGKGWKVYENRYWPVEVRVGDQITRFDAATWEKLDAEVERSRAKKEAGPLATGS